MPQPKDIVIGKRVRINEVPDELLSKNYLGKMATVKGLDRPDAGSPNCLLKMDRVTELILLPATYLETLEPQPSSLLANDLFLPWDMNDPKTRLSTFLEDKWLAGHILEMMMFYDCIIVPTVDFAIIAPLVHWIGPPTIKEMLESGALSFVDTEADWLTREKRTVALARLNFTLPRKNHPRRPFGQGQQRLLWTRRLPFNCKIELLDSRNNGSKCLAN